MLKQCRILLVDDHPVHRILVERSLPRDVFDLTSVCDGDEAIEILSTKEFDLVVTDLVMPKKNGFELNAYIKREHPELPVVLWTSEHEFAESHQPQHGFVAIFKKPFDYSTLVVHLNRVLKSLDGSNN